MYAMANRNVSILLKRFSYGNVGTCTRNSSKAELMLLPKVEKRGEKLEPELMRCIENYLFLFFLCVNLNPDCAFWRKVESAEHFVRHCPPYQYLKYFNEKDKHVTTRLNYDATSKK